MDLENIAWEGMEDTDKNSNDSSSVGSSILNNKDALNTTLLRENVNLRKQVAELTKRLRNLEEMLQKQTDRTMERLNLIVMQTYKSDETEEVSNRRAATKNSSSSESEQGHPKRGQGNKRHSQKQITSMK